MLEFTSRSGPLLVWMTSTNSASFGVSACFIASSKKYGRAGSSPEILAIFAPVFLAY